MLKQNYVKTEHGHKWDPLAFWVCTNCGILVGPGVKQNGWVYVTDNKYDSWYCEDIQNGKLVKEIIE